MTRFLVAESKLSPGWWQIVTTDGSTTTLKIKDYDDAVNIAEIAERLYSSHLEKPKEVEELEEKRELLCLLMCQLKELLKSKSDDVLKTIAPDDSNPRRTFSKKYEAAKQEVAQIDATLARLKKPSKLNYEEVVNIASRIYFTRLAEHGGYRVP